jgi:hypothetical protein
VINFESVYAERETDEVAPVHPAASIKYDELGTLATLARSPRMRRKSTHTHAHLDANLSSLVQ